MNKKGIAILVLVAVILFLLFGPRAARFGDPAVQGTDLNAGGIAAAPVDTPTNPITSMVSSASLIPNDVSGTEDFSQFSPDAILGGQNYLDPRAQLGYPETLGGTLRNANRDVRSEPANPRTPVSIFNLSTISPDVMRPQFEIDYEYQ